MSHPLDGCWAKVKRAHEHFEELKTKIAAALDYADSVKLHQHFDANTSTIHLALEDVPELPVEWALIAADFLQNLRAALNYLAWELARWNLAQLGKTGDPHWRTQFPIHTKPLEFNRDYVRDLHPDHIARIEALQPNGPDYLSQFDEGTLLAVDTEWLTTRSPLGRLAQLTNDDKHRVLSRGLLGVRASGPGSYEAVDCMIVGMTGWVHRALENGAPWVEFKVTPTGSKPEVQVKDVGILETEVEFGGTPDFSGAGINSDFPLIGETVESICREFKPVF